MLNHFLIPGDNEEPITRVAIRRDGGRCLFGTRQGSLLAYGLDLAPTEPLALPGSYGPITGIAFVRDGAEALVTARRGTDSGEILRVGEEGTTQVVYPDAPHPFAHLALSDDGALGLLVAGDVLLRYYPEQRSYLPVDSPPGLRLRAAAFAPGGRDALVVGGSGARGFVARYRFEPDRGVLEMLEAPALPALETVAWSSDGRFALAGGGEGELAAITPENGVRPVRGPGNRVFNSIAFHPEQPWALVAVGGAGPGHPPGALHRYECAGDHFTLEYEAPSGMGALTAVALTSDGTKAVAGTEWGQLVELHL